jgi:hypothetical protein
MEDEMLQFWTYLLIVMVIAAIILFPISMAFGQLLTREPPRLGDLIGVFWSRRRTYHAAVTMMATSSVTITTNVITGATVSMLPHDKMTSGTSASALKYITPTHVLTAVPLSTGSPVLGTPEISVISSRTGSLNIPTSGQRTTLQSAAA